MDRAIRILIIEDSAIWISALEIIIKDLEMDVVKSVSTLEDALIAFREEAFDVALIDVQIGHTDCGLELGNIAHNIYRKPYIYITAGNGYDLEKIAEYRPAAYLQKPINANSLNIAIRQAIGQLSPVDQDIKRQDPENSEFFIKDGTTYKKLSWTNISHATAGKNYVSVHNIQDKKEYYIRTSLQKLHHELIPRHLQDNFVQISKSQIVQFSYVQEISPDMVKTEYNTLNFSDNYHKELKSKMNLV